MAVLHLNERRESIFSIAAIYGDYKLDYKPMLSVFDDSYWNDVHRRQDELEGKLDAEEILSIPNRQSKNLPDTTLTKCGNRAPISQFWNRGGNSYSFNRLQESKLDRMCRCRSAGPNCNSCPAYFTIEFHANGRQTIRRKAISNWFRTVVPDQNRNRPVNGLNA